MRMDCLQARGLDNGQMQMPAMGYNTWNGFHDNITEELVLQTVDLMVDLGLSSAGYKYINIDGALGGLRPCLNWIAAGFERLLASRRLVREAKG